MTRRDRRVTPFKLFGIVALILSLAGFISLHLLLSWGLLLTWLASVNVVTLAFFGFDKLTAQRHGRRVPEDVLYALVILGGWLGALVGMVLFHHKVSKRSFQSVFWTIIALEIAALCVWHFVLR